MIVNRLVLYDINIILITPGEDAAKFIVHQNSLGDAANTPNTPNSSEICMF